MILELKYIPGIFFSNNEIIKTILNSFESSQKILVVEFGIFSAS